MTLRRSHDCVRCGTTISPGEEFGAVDVLDPAGEMQVLVCVDCAADLRVFLDVPPDDETAEATGKRPDDSDTEKRPDDSGSSIR